MIFKRKAERKPAEPLREKLSELDSAALRLIQGDVFGDSEEPARAAAADLLRQRGEDQKPDGDCPLCGGELVRGDVSVHGTAWRFLLIGLSWQSAWFTSRENGEKQMVFGSWARTAARCEDCRTLLVREP